MHRKMIIFSFRWWKNLEVESNLSYVRDRLVECYFWVVSVYFEPKYNIGRRIVIKSLSLLLIIDDTYDAYGTFVELNQFTDAIHR